MILFSLLPYTKFAEEVLEHTYSSGVANSPCSAVLAVPEQAAYPPEIQNGEARNQDVSAERANSTDLKALHNVHWCSGKRKNCTITKLFRISPE